MVGGSLLAWGWESLHLAARDPEQTGLLQESRENRQLGLGLLLQLGSQRFTRIQMRKGGSGLRGSRR